MGVSMTTMVDALRNTGSELLELDAEELERRYTDWVAQLRVELPLIDAVYAIQIDARDQPPTELHQRVVNLLALLELVRSRADRG
jgi:hypothetical protein